MSDKYCECRCSCNPLCGCVCHAREVERIARAEEEIARLREALTTIAEWRDVPFDKGSHGAQQHVRVLVRAALQETKRD